MAPFGPNSPTWWYIRMEIPLFKANRPSSGAERAIDYCAMTNDYRSLWMPPGSVRSVLALLVVGGAVAAAFAVFLIAFVWQLCRMWFGW